MVQESSSRTTTATLQHYHGLEYVWHRTTRWEQNPNCSKDYLACREHRKIQDDKIKDRKCFLLYCTMHCFCFLPFSSSSKKELSLEVFSACATVLVSKLKNKLLIRTAFAEEMKKTKWCKNQAAGRRRQLYNTTREWNTCDTGRHDGNKTQIAIRITWRAEITEK